MKGFDDHLDNYGDPDPGDDLPEPAFTIYDDALYDALSDDEPTVVVEGREYDILASGDVVCPECGASRSVIRIADHMASEHSDDDSLYPECEHTPPCTGDREDAPCWNQPREETGNE